VKITFTHALPFGRTHHPGGMGEGVMSAFPTAGSRSRATTTADFEWQGGICGFLREPSNLEQVKGYIAGQAEHHRKMTVPTTNYAPVRKHEIELMNAMCGIEAHPWVEFFRPVTQGSSCLQPWLWGGIQTS